MPPHALNLAVTRMFNFPPVLCFPIPNARRKAFQVSEEVKGIVKIFKEVAKPDAPGITKREFRSIFFKRDPANRHRVDTKLEDEICSDMFRILDKKGEGYVTLEDLLKHFIPRKQVLWKPFL